MKAIDAAKLIQTAAESAFSVHPDVTTFGGLAAFVVVRLLRSGTVTGGPNSFVVDTDEGTFSVTIEAGRIYVIGGKA